MRVLTNLFILGGIAVSLALPQLALSADEKAKIDETQSHDRGFAFTPINEPGGAQTPAAAKKTVDTNKTVKIAAPVKKAPENNVARSNLHSRSFILTAVKKPPKAPTAVKTETAVANQSANKNQTQEVQAVASSPNALVKFDGGSVISARLDKAGGTPSYKVGDKMVVKVRANQDCNVVVFNYDSTGTLTQIFPNDYQQDGFVKSGDTVEIGGAESPFDYQISGKGGPEKVFVYAYPTGSDFGNPLTAMGRSVSHKVALAPIAGTPFRGADMSIEQYRNLVNQSQVFFSRSVEVKPKSQQHGTAQLVSSSPAQTNASPNKVELTFNVEK